MGLDRETKNCQDVEAYDECGRGWIFWLYLQPWGWKGGVILDIFEGGRTNDK